MLPVALSHTAFRRGLSSASDPKIPNALILTGFLDRCTRLAPGTLAEVGVAVCQTAARELRVLAVRGGVLDDVSVILLEMVDERTENVLAVLRASQRLRCPP